ncbi:alkyl sulfatase BDS1-like metallo-beta-lactamase superfamily hydrolase [Nocardioides cavernae]|uniref:Alkyl sulfatase BDS1-like metallo-beta-lactamase superfamily hydrolase n=1 Tax=Nocardioides cavernae TaxID=1921566 RepID=A0A7Y9H1D3_9ACTN|nr:alkyl sulfatase dimerization domain-containing protein [Nocardioides cavernae]NYE35851.1 alkyl sulfatase BDS1-like metallo-beta-lactamase superfamily hydrolase [Nocardioides cavernae]
MARFASRDHRFEVLCAWEPEKPAEQVADGILLSRGISSAYVVTTPDGDVVVNTGTRLEGDRHRERFEQLLGRPLSVRAIVFTQDHPDHVGGWQAFDDPGVQLLAEASFPAGRAERGLLKTFYRPRFRRLMSGFSAAPAPAEVVDRPAREPEDLVLVEGRADIVVGGTTFELIPVPGGETTNCLAVWLPEHRVLLVGNHMGALYGAIPNLYTLRGDKPRSARQFVADLEVLLDLDADLLLTGHGDPVRGADTIRADLTRLRDAVRFIHDETLRGMNDGKDLHTLMREVVLPPDLEPASGRGPVSWYVRTVWEEYTGWFQHDLTSQLYAVPARAVWPEVVELAGGADRLAERAAARLAAGEAEQALHLVEMALVAEPENRAALDVHADVLDALIARTGGQTYDELVWLETERERTRESYAADPYGNRPG